MVKQTQTIIWQQPTNCLSVFSHFEGSTLKELRGSFLANFPVPRQKSTTVALRHMCYQLFPTISKIIPSRGVLIKRYSKNICTKFAEEHPWLIAISIKSTGVRLQMCCVFSGHLFIRTPTERYYFKL